MLYQKNEILLLDTDEIVRILDLRDLNVELISITSLKMPVQTKIESLKVKKVLSKEEMLEKTQRYIPDENKLSEKQKVKMWERYRSFVLPLISAEDIRHRTQKIKEIAKERKISKQTIRNYYILYLAFDDIAVLAPIERSHPTELTDWQKIYRKYLNKYYYSSKQYTLVLTYQTMLQQEFINCKGELLPPKERPTFNQFKYFKRNYKSNTVINTVISRQGMSEFAKNHRNLVGGGTNETYCSYPTEIYFVDATELDIYLVSTENNSQVVGRPYLYAAIDVFSGMIAGISLLYEGSTFSVYQLLKNVITPKDIYCKSLGIDIEDTDWPIHSLPGRIVTDRGKEFDADVVSQMAVFTEIEILDAYRPDLKSKVEQFFHSLQDLIKPSLNEKGGIRNDWQQRGAQDYQLTAALNIQQLERIIVHSILYLNKHIQENYPFTPDMLKSHITPTAIGLYEYGMNKFDVRCRHISEQLLYQTLLPRVDLPFTRQGVRFNAQLYYVNFDKVYLNKMLLGKETGIFAYDSDNLNQIYLYENNRYIPFTLIQKRFEGFSLEDFEDVDALRRRILNEYRETDLQEKVNLLNNIETIVSSVDTITPRKKNRKNEYKERERRRKRNE